MILLFLLGCVLLGLSILGLAGLFVVAVMNALRKLCRVDSYAGGTMSKRLRRLENVARSERNGERRKRGLLPPLPKPRLVYPWQPSQPSKQHRCANGNGAWCDDCRRALTAAGAKRKRRRRRNMLVALMPAGQP